MASLEDKAIVLNVVQLTQELVADASSSVKVCRVTLLPC
jgi:hypothetical protein